MISIVIPVYKNKELFLNNLKNNLRFLNDNEIIIVNDDPQSSLQVDLKEFENIKLIENKKNLGFGPSVNIGIKEAKNKYILLLNSDVKLQDDKYKSALEYFNTDKQLFAVAFAQKEKDSLIVGRNMIYWQSGFIQHKKNPVQDFGINAWAEGGASILDKDKFELLGGFDPIYTPYYWEDIDLSYCAWKKGFKILFDPEVLVEHHHESTIAKYYSKKKMEQIAFRNQLLFIWKNISDKKLLIEHFIRLIFFLLKSILKGNFNFILGFLSALTKIGSIQKEKGLLSDQEIINKFHVIPVKAGL